MGIFEIIIAVGVLAGLALSVGSYMRGDQFVTEEKSEIEFSGPRSTYGDAIPIVFGTVQIESPLVIEASDAFLGPVYGGWTYFVPYEAKYPPDDGETFAGGYTGGIANAERYRNQFVVDLDLLLTERIYANNAIIGEVRLKRIWVGQGLLWVAPTGSNITTYGSLLSTDPGRTNTASTPAGSGIRTPYEAGTRWKGGVVEPAETGDGGDVLGWWRAALNEEETEWILAYGMESVIFHPGSVGDEREGFVRLQFDQFVWGSRPSLDPVTVEITQTCPAPAIGDSSGLMPNGLDVNPVSVLYVILTSTQFAGGSKTPAIDIASFSAARAIISDEGLGISYNLASPTKVSALIDMLLNHIDGIIHRDPETGFIKLTLLRAAENIDALPVLTERVTVSVDGFSKSTWDSVFSQCRVTYTEREGGPEDRNAQNVAMAEDPGLAESMTMVETIDDNAPLCFDSSVANALAARKLAVSNTPLIAATIKFNRKRESGFSALDLRPGSMFRWTYAPLFITEPVVWRVSKVDYGTLDDNAVTVTVIQDRFLAPPIVTPPVPTDRPDPPLKEDAEIELRAITAPYHFARLGLAGDARKLLTSGMASSYLDGEDWEIQPAGFNKDRWMLLSRKPYPEANRFGAQIVKGTQIVDSVIAQYTPSGQLDTEITDYAGGINHTYDMVESVVPFDVVDLDFNPSSFLSDGLYRDGRNLMLIDDEWFLIVNWTALSSTSIRVTYYQRMLWDSPPDITADSGKFSHSVGSRVWFFDLRNEETEASKLSKPHISNEFECYRLGRDDPNFADRWVPTSPNEKKWATGYGPTADDWVIRASNIDRFRNNLTEVVSGLWLDDRANRFHPIRRWWLAYASTDGTGESYDIYTINMINGATLLTLFMADDYENKANLSPREYGNPVKIFDASGEIIYFSEEDEIPTSLSEVVESESAKFGVECGMIAYRTPDEPTHAALRFAKINSDGSVSLSMPSTSTARRLELYHYRAIRIGDDIVAQQSVPAMLVIVVTRTGD